MAGGLAPRRGEIISQINVTPLVDIMLVLLIIFMVTASYIVRSSIETKLPEITTGQDVKTSTLAVELRLDGSLLVNGQATTEDGLKAIVAEKKREDPAVQALIAADERVSHGDFVRLVDRVRYYGISRFAIVGERQR